MLTSSEVRRLLGPMLRNSDDISNDPEDAEQPLKSIRPALNLNVVQTFIVAGRISV
jgi:hypothetical protein